MKIIEDISPEIEKIENEELILLLGGSLSNAEKTRKIIEDNHDVIKEAQNLASPRSIFDVIPIEGISGDRLYISKEEYFESSLMTYFMQDAQYAAFSISTIGPEIEEKSKDYMNNHEYVKALLVDGVGNLILQKLELQTYRHIEEDARSMGLLPSAPLSPGQAGWNVADQKMIHSRLPADKIGVQVSETSLLVPKKSGSMIVGIGENVMRKGRACDYCHLQETCPSRKVKDYRNQHT